MILSDPSKDDFVIANISSQQGPPENKVQLNKGDHSFCKHDSYVRCDKARMALKAEFEQAVRKGLVTQSKDPRHGRLHPADRDRTRPEVGLLPNPFEECAQVRAEGLPVGLAVAVEVVLREANREPESIGRRLHHHPQDLSALSAANVSLSAPRITKTLDARYILSHR